MQRKKSILFLIMPAALLAILSLTLFWQSQKTHFSDKYLAAHLSAHIDLFASLIEMMRQDTIIKGISNSRVLLVDEEDWDTENPTSSFSLARFDMYRAIVDKLDVQWIGRESFNPDVIYFMLSSKGLTTGGSEKGLVFSEKSLAPLVDSLEGEETGESVRKGVILEQKKAYRSLRDGWYIYFSFDN